MIEALIEAGVGRLDAQQIADRLYSDLTLTARQALDNLAPMTNDQMIEDARLGWWSSEGVAPEFRRLLDAEATGDPQIEDPETIYAYLPGKAWPDWLLERLYCTARDQWQAISGRTLPDLPADPNIDKVLTFLGEIDHAYPGHPAQILRLYLDATQGDR